MAISPPSALTLSQRIRSIVLSWTPSGTAGVSYTVFRDRSANGFFQAVGTNISGTTYADFNVLPGVVYRYYVVATLAGAESTPTSTAAATFVSCSKNTAVESRDTSASLGAITVAAGVVAAGCGEFQRLQRLRGRAIGCGK
jgi:hypothetical protein